MFSFVLSAALAADQVLVYDLSVNGQAVGTRTVSITYLARESSERRIVEAYSELKLGSNSWKVRSTSTSTSRSASFTASIDANGALSMVQGLELEGGGWSVRYSDNKGTREYTVPRASGRISSMDLYDPGRAGFLDAPGAFGLLLVETGDSVVGTLKEGIAGEVLLDGHPIPVQKYVLAGEGGLASFELDENGILVRSEVRWMGMQVQSQLQDPPPLRNVGEIQSFEGIGPLIQSEELK
jgi:hypothetical protein